MTDNLTPEQRSSLMAGIKGKNTKPEMLLRKLLWENGYRYRLHYQKLPGKPDVVFPGRRKAIFIHGCFWHMHDCNHFSWPKTNMDFWGKKIRGNIERDQRNQKMISTLGWEVLVIWECEFSARHWQHIWDKVIYFLNNNNHLPNRKITKSMTNLLT